MPDKNIETIKKLEESNVLLNVLLAFEEFLDKLDIYTFPNWFEGEVAQGPEIERYWVHVVLKYPYTEMPDPQGAKRIYKHGGYVKYVKAKQKFVDVPLDNVVKADDNKNVSFVSPSTISGGEGGPHQKANEHIKYKDIWLVIISLPKRFIDDITEAGLEDYSEVVDTEEVSNAQDEGIDDENVHKDDKEEEEEEEEEF